MKSAFFFIVTFCFFAPLCGQNNKAACGYVNPKILFRDSIHISDVDDIHPHLHESLNPAEIDSFKRLIRHKKQEITTDSVSITEYIHIARPLLNKFLYEDPHFRVLPFPRILNKKIDMNEIHVLPVSVLIINDTVLVDKSWDALFHKGDRIVSINRVPITRYLEYAYNDRYTDCYVLQQYYHFDFPSHYHIEIERNGVLQHIETSGKGYKKNQYELRKADNKQEIFHEYKTGYITLNKFYPNNSNFIKTLASFIQKVQKSGYKNVIIDVRKNNGGNGDKFDHLISLFTDTNSLSYIRKQRLRVSKYVLEDYDFLNENMIGQLVDIPDEYLNKTIPLKPSNYLGDMNYYVLISRNTSSIAASFVNILQTNNWAKLVGEPLMHNALKYGETIPLGWNSPYLILIFSTVEIEEYTQSPDGQIYPDIEIPYVASEYMQGGDPLLEKLLKYIQQQTP